MNKTIDLSKGEIGYGQCSTCGAKNNACGCPLVIQKGNYGIGTTAPQTYIQLNANSLRDAWQKLISLTTHILLEKIGIKYTMFDKV